MSVVVDKKNQFINYLTTVSSISDFPFVKNAYSTNIAGTSLISYSKGFPFNSLKLFSPQSTYLIISNNSSLPYTLYSENDIARVAQKDITTPLAFATFYGTATASIKGFVYGSNVVKTYTTDNLGNYVSYVSGFPFNSVNFFTPGSGYFLYSTNIPYTFYYNPPTPTPTKTLTPTPTPTPTPTQSITPTPTPTTTTYVDFTITNITSTIDINYANLYYSGGNFALCSDIVIESSIDGYTWNFLYIKKDCSSPFLIEFPDFTLYGYYWYFRAKKYFNKVLTATSQVATFNVLTNQFSIVPPPTPTQTPTQSITPTPTHTPTLTPTPTVPFPWQTIINQPCQGESLLGTLTSYGTDNEPIYTGTYVQLTSAVNNARGGLIYNLNLSALTDLHVSFDFRNGNIPYGADGTFVSLYLGDSSLPANSRYYTGIRENNAKFVIGFDEYPKSRVTVYDPELPGPYEYGYPLSITDSQFKFNDGNWHTATIIYSNCNNERTFDTFVDGFKFSSYYENTVRDGLTGSFIHLQSATGFLNNTHQVKNIVIKAANLLDNCVPIVPPTPTPTLTPSPTPTLTPTSFPAIPYNEFIDIVGLRNFSYDGLGTPASFGSFGSLNHTPNSLGYITLKVKKPVKIDFTSIISSEEDYDFGRIFFNDENYYTGSGYDTFGLGNAIFNPGDTIRFEYEKDDSIDIGLDQYQITYFICEDITTP